MPDDVFLCPNHGCFEVDSVGDVDAHDAVGDAHDAADDVPCCPQCGTAGTSVLAGSRRRRLSTFLSGALRHFPDDVGLSLDEAGWTDFDTVVAAASRQYEWASRRAVVAVVTTDPKGRFERRRGRVRAAYGHSVAVDLDADLEGDTDHDIDDDPNAPPADGTDDDADHDTDDNPADDPNAPPDAEMTAADATETGRAGSDGRTPPDLLSLYHGTAPENVASIEATGLKPMARQLVHLSPDVETARAVGSRHTDGEPVVFVVDVPALVSAGFEVRKRGRETYTVERVPPAVLDRVDEATDTDLHN